MHINVTFSPDSSKTVGNDKLSKREGVREAGGEFRSLGNGRVVANLILFRLADSFFLSCDAYGGHRVSEP